MARKINYSEVDGTDTFTLARAANLWAGYPPAYSTSDKPLVAGEPAEDQTARPIQSIPSASEALRGIYLDSDAYDVATAMKAAVKGGRLGKREREPRMITVRTRSEYRAFALDMRKWGGWKLPPFLFKEERSWERGEYKTTRLQKGLVRIIARDIAPQRLTIAAVSQWLEDYSHTEFKEWEEEFQRVGIESLQYFPKDKLGEFRYWLDGGNPKQPELSSFKLRNLEKYVTAYNRELQQPETVAP